MQNNIVLITFITLMTCLVMIGKAEASAVTEHYKVVQDHITIKVAPKSGLPKASCVFFDEDHNKIAGQNVTIVDTFDNITIIEANMYYNQHVQVVKVECK